MWSARRIPATPTPADAIVPHRRRCLHSALLAGFIMIMLAGNLPVRPVRQLLHLLTLDQSWDVFAPDPTRTQLELRAAVEFSDGSETTWQPLHASPALSLLTYHWDAWANSAALGYPIAFRSVARWIAAT